MVSDIPLMNSKKLSMGKKTSDQQRREFYSKGAKKALLDAMKPKVVTEDIKEAEDAYYYMNPEDETNRRRLLNN